MGWCQGAALLLAETLALGVLSFPNIASQIGIAPTIVATIGLAYLAWVTEYILMDFKVNHPAVMSFADAGKVVGGPIFKWVLFVGIMVNTVFIAASHVNSGGTAFVEMSHNARCSVLLGFCMALLGFVFTTPRKFQHTSYASFVSCGSIVTACLITVIACGFDRDQWKDASGSVTYKAAANPGLIGVINSFTNIVFAYGGHAAIFSFCSEMKNPNDFKKSLGVVQLVSTLFYITVGIGVYALVGENKVKSPALSIPRYKVEIAAYAIAMVSIIVAGVLPALVGIKQLWLEFFREKPMLTSNNWKAQAIWTALAFVTWMLALVLAQLIPFFSSLLSIISSITNMWFTYGLSGVIWLWDNKRGSHRSPGGWFASPRKVGMGVLSALTIVLAAVITPLGMYTAIESIKSS
ncbi:hypothetical protein E3P89_00573 [Wallemia ichthyophaga]|uniref:Amino acid transporter transmembrane domain-containing protein n=1 Tax=Wallemia ichthyophaga TaxID=245174 RepID=A0A4V4M0G6_WALIC|nr:hypothetical protein E3P90_00732 [Wallemia ichthyophaga]TIB17664.1 hypothetical protein E3P93_00589 [Wallemia ichthyophaga]TIB25157.1 hypothetical protein E3P89_00573 [Wallemia ichthyophaga]TIB26891.1 hypothetical protein E3P88_00601 [Wallemia ichthyophaga]